jgi:hypothetical protein
MDSNPQENLLQALFGELRQQDQRLAPSFEPQVSAALRRGKEATRIGYTGYAAAVAAAVSVAVLAGTLLHRPAGQPAIAVRLPRPDRSTVVPAEQPALSLGDWQSPTAFLLQASDEWGQPAQTPDRAGPASTQPLTQDPT